MYAKHFGLNSRPFRSGSDMSGIFVGPAQAKIIANVNKALAASDAVVAVTGPVGVGKTTVVNRALEGIVNKRVVARVGRMQLAADEVLELLITEFKLSHRPAGTIQRFAAFKHQLAVWAAAGTRAFIIVEDAERIGTDALIELEALSAADNGDGSGASILLMGQPTLADLLAMPALARLRQRVRLRQTAAKFSAAEVRGYLKHCIRNAGGDFDQIFDPDAVDMLHRCSEGIPRIINNLCEAVLVAAADANAPLVMPQLVQHIAHEEFGLDPSMRTPALTVPEFTSATNRTLTEKPAETSARRLEPRLSPAAPARPIESKPAKPALADFEPVPVAAFTAEPEHKWSALPKRNPLPDAESIKLVETGTLMGIKAPGKANPVPDLIQDTQPGLAAMTVEDDLPDLADLADQIVPARTTWSTTSPSVMPTRPNGPSVNGTTDVKAKDPVPPKPPVKAGSRVDWTDSSLPILDDIPTLTPEPKIEKRPKPSPAPLSGKNAQSPAKAAPARVTPGDPAGVDNTEEKKDTTITEIPDWDRSPALAELNPDFSAIEAALAQDPEAPDDAAINSTDKMSDERPVDAQQTPASPKVFDLPEITLEKKLQSAEGKARPADSKSSPPPARDAEPRAVPKSNSGPEMDRIAAELGKARSLEDVDDKLAETLFGEEMANASAAVAAMIAADEAAKLPVESPAKPTAATLDDSRSIAGEKPKAPVQNAPSVRRAPPAAPKATAPVLNPKPVEITLQSDPDPESPRAESTPDPIEDQFGTSMTATLKALSAAQVQKMHESANDEDDDEDGQEKPPRRLFGLFRGNY